MKPTILRFKAKAMDMGDVQARLFPNGIAGRNATEWRGKAPRSCLVTEIHSSNAQFGVGPHEFDVTVSYRPKGYITYENGERFDGWVKMVPKRADDGTYLDEDGSPLQYGRPRAYLPLDVADEVEFNQIDFGDFQSEIEAPSVKHTTSENFMESIKGATTIGASISETYPVPRRNPAHYKIIICNQPTGLARNQFGHFMIVLNNELPQLEQVLLDKIEEVLIGYLEGRNSIKTLTADDQVFVELSNIVVDCTPNEFGQDSWFDVLNNYVPAKFLEQLAMRVMAIFKLDVTVVDGPKPGFILRRT